MKSPVEYCPTSGKVKYDKKGATTAANHRYEVAHTELRIYPCPSCNTWHLTHTQLNKGKKPWRRR